MIRLADADVEFDADADADADQEMGICADDVADADAQADTSSYTKELHSSQRTPSPHIICFPMKWEIAESLFQWAIFNVASWISMLQVGFLCCKLVFNDFFSIFSKIGLPRPGP